MFKVLSLFDGLSCCHLALDRVGIKVDKYYAAEIDKYAMQVTQANYPETVQLGSVTDWIDWNIPWHEIDLVTGGFPCQAWSIAGKQLGDKDERGMLFWTMLDIIGFAKSRNPNIKFLIENVKMKKEFEEYITKHTTEALGEVNKILINSALVSAQNRNRYYWHNIDGVDQPEDRSIILKDILEDDGVGHEKRNYLNEVQKSKLVECDKRGNNTNILYHRKGYNNNTKVFNPEYKSGCLDTAGGGGREAHTIDEIGIRKLTPLEYERLQTIPDNHTNHVSNSQRYKMIGNGWTVDVISHIFKGLQNV